MERGPTTRSLSGDAYDIDEKTTLYAFPGVVYKRLLIDETKARCAVVNPANIAEFTANRESRSVTRTILSAGSHAYIFADEEAIENIYGAYHYLYENQIWRFDEQLLVSQQVSEKGAQAVAASGSYLRLSHERRDPLCLPIERFENGLETGEFRPLWRISSSPSDSSS